MRRREFLGVLGSAAAAWPLTMRAQPSSGMRRIGVQIGQAESDRQGQAFVAAFRDELRKLGWVEGGNVRIDTRWATAGDAEARQRFAKELVALQPDLLLSHGTPTTATLLQQTRTIAIIFAAVSDPIGSGFVASFPQPGGNVTGFMNMSRRWPESGSRCSRRLRRASPGSLSYSTRQRRHMPKIG
jgi:putative tryptophan/tyrosine transport system substrate-binding protein